MLGVGCWMFGCDERRDRMGLTIHWTVELSHPAPGTEVAARMAAWRKACLDLPFELVTELVHFDEAEIGRILDDKDAAERWFVVQAGAYCPADPNDPEASPALVDPLEIVGFTAFPGEECEPMNCLLARYPEVADVNGRSVRPGVTGWRGSAFTKTQYASTVSAEHFLRCHRTVVAALDAAKALGLLGSVLDESEYWHHRDDARLLATVQDWNAKLAGFVGALETVTGEETPAPIKRHPEFERLEHQGLDRDATLLAKAVARVLKKEP